MAQHPVEIILIRQLAEYLSTPVFVFDANATLVFYNEAADSLLGRSYEETGEITVVELVARFNPTDLEGEPLDADHFPVAVALRKQTPSHRKFHVVGPDGVRRTIESTAIPMVGQRGKLLGAMTIFWELPRS